MPRYKCVWSKSSELFEQEVNKLAEQGWEMFQFTFTGGAWAAIMERQVPGDEGSK